MMPDDQLKQFTPAEVLSLLAYLAAPAQVPVLADEKNASTLFNGRDLTGWQGNMDLWSVENGELVGRSQGLKKNEFLISDMAATNFKLSFEVKLVGNAGNSGVQFRSTPQEHGVKGYQADIGEGWWGKLYEEEGRALLWPKSGEEHVKKGEWNKYEIVADGSQVKTYINGQLCVDLDDAPGARRGIFALQLHSAAPPKFASAVSSWSQSSRNGTLSLSYNLLSESQLCTKNYLRKLCACPHELTHRYQQQRRTMGLPSVWTLLPWQSGLLER